MVELHEDEDDTFSILSIDPGTSTLGFCVIKLKIETLEIVSIFAWTVDATRLAFYKDEIIAIHGEKFARIISHKRNLEQVLRFYDPVFVVCETPFFNRLRPSAGGPLYELYATIEQTVFEWDRYKPLYGIDPRTVKKGVKAQGNKKPDMLEAMQKIPELSCAGLDLLDEHAIDSVAVGYHKVLELRKRKDTCKNDRQDKTDTGVADNGNTTAGTGVLQVLVRTRTIKATRTRSKRRSQYSSTVKRKSKKRHSIL